MPQCLADERMRNRPTPAVKLSLTMSIFSVCQYLTPRRHVLHRMCCQPQLSAARRTIAWSSKAEVTAKRERSAMNILADRACLSRMNTVTTELPDQSGLESAELVGPCPASEPLGKEFFSRCRAKVLLAQRYIRGVRARGLFVYHVFRVVWNEALDILHEPIETYPCAQFVEC